MLLVPGPTSAPKGDGPAKEREEEMLEDWSHTSWGCMAAGPQGPGTAGERRKAGALHSPSLRPAACSRAGRPGKSCSHVMGLAADTYGALRQMLSYPHFADEETEAQGGK